MRARLPDHEGDALREGVSTHYCVYGNGERTILLMPNWSIVHSRTWKAQVPYLSRHYRVITADARGSGRSDRPAGAAAYRDQEIVADTVAVLDATGTQRVVVVGTSYGGHLAALLAALHPGRVEGALLIAPSAPFGPRPPGRDPARTALELERHEGWDKFNLPYWEGDGYADFLRFFFSQTCSEPHSTKQIEDGVAWGLETTGAVLADTVRGRATSQDNGEAVYRQIRCPVRVIHGDDDRVIPYGKGVAVAEATGGDLLTIAGGGHLTHAREPVKINRLIKDFADGLAPRPPVLDSTWTRGRSRERKALYLSSPIGLGHARRDLAVAQALRERRPGLHIDWLTQDPVTTFLEGTGEAVHAASRLLVNESAHIESECGEHDLNAFQALRSMDEIMVANFHVFQEVVEAGHYDLVIADEAWDVDHFWHEHPELKRGALAWFTDFVGFLPFSDGGEWEAGLTADYNAEMIEHVERFPWVRDRALFVGDAEDIVPDAFGPQLPAIKDWTQRHFDFTGYITGYDPREFGESAALRSALGMQPGEKVCIVSVGGSGVGTPLLRRILQAVPLARKRIPELRVLMVTGPRIDPAALPATPGVELRGYVPGLHRYLAACDLAVVQGGLTTCMELTAARRPFLYFPLHHHFEQQFHVQHRLRRYGAGRAMDYARSDPDAIAEAMVAELGRPLQVRPVATDGAARAATLLAEMI
jgi:pimeloyl-ACP methyl ester carboxylesterase/predicted glycosyltransferase